MSGVRLSREQLDRAGLVLLRDCPEVLDQGPASGPVCPGCRGPRSKAAQLCAGCRTAERERMRATGVQTYPKGGVKWQQPVPTGHLLVVCWCERGAAFVPERDVWRGLTGSCGRWGCGPP